jgi:hypothetical protein
MLSCHRLTVLHNLTFVLHKLALIAQFLSLCSEALIVNEDFNPDALMLQAD